MELQTVDIDDLRERALLPPGVYSFDSECSRSRRGTTAIPAGDFQRVSRCPCHFVDRDTSAGLRKMARYVKKVRDASKRKCHENVDTATTLGQGRWGI